jgi:hypothetical protein
MLIIALFILGIVSRLSPHIPNFSPIIAIALFSGAYLNKKHSLWVPVLLYIVSDLILGLHGVVLFTWMSILIITLLGRALRKRRGITNNLAYTLLSSILFFIITNFGVWMVGWYGPSLGGLAQCYIQAMPFFRTSIIADLSYILLLTGVFNLVTAKVEDKKVKFALLTV